jgi:hypothetical protein
MVLICQFYLRRTTTKLQSHGWMSIVAPGGAPPREREVFG